MRDGLTLDQLRRWQCRRLERTYQDLQRDPRYRPAAVFFFDDLYGSGHFTKREQDVHHVYPIMTRMLPHHFMETIDMALELSDLTRELDAQLLAALRETGVGVGGEDRPITDRSYAAAYRRCDNYDERAHQIELICHAGEELDSVVRKPFVGAALRLARKPAHLAGMGALQDFIEHGYRAFRHLGGGAEVFLDIVQRRETRILDRIFAGHPRPFETDPPQKLR